MADEIIEWLSEYIRTADNLPESVTASNYDKVGASTHGTRAMASAVRYFNKRLKPLGWVLDEENTYVDTWTGHGHLEASLDGVASLFVLDGEYQNTLKKQWNARNIPEPQPAMKIIKRKARKSNKSS